MPDLEWPRVAFCGLRIARQYFCRVEAALSLLLLYIIWIYVRWLGDRYRPAFAGKHLQHRNASLLYVPNYHISFSTLKTNNRNLWTYSNEDWSFCGVQGIRYTMEDRVDVIKHMQLSYFGLYDGHGGQFVSDYLEKNLSLNILQRYMESLQAQDTINMSKILNSQILKIDAQISSLDEPLEYTGSTLVCVALYDNRYLTFANVGDSRAIVGLANGRAQQVTVDHKPNSESEKKRIESSGGSVIWYGVWRVAGILATSRALGDTYLKRLGYLTAQPDLFVLDMTVHSPSFVIIASDGLWDVVSNQQAVDIVRAAINNKEPMRGADTLVNFALKLNTSDNVSVMVIPLTKWSRNKR